MNIMKRLTALTSLTVCVGILAPTTIAFANTGSTNDSHIMKSKDPERKIHAVGFGLNDPNLQPESNSITKIFGNSLLQQGDNGPTVAEIQDELHRLGYYNGEINGVFGDLTAEAVRLFQSDHNISENGFVGADTKTALYTFYRDSNEARTYMKRTKEIKEQEKKAAEEAAKKAAREREEAAKAAREKKTADRNNQIKKQPTAKVPVKRTAYKPAKKTRSESSDSRKTLTVTATSYALDGVSSTGINFSSNPNAKVIAVDPGVIPLGSRVMIPGYGIYIAADTGGSIKGKRIDIHFPTKKAAVNFGRRTLTIRILH